MAPQRPIGFWLKLLDQLINEQFAAILDEHGVTRRQWQVMNLLTNGPAGRDELAEALAPFVDGTEPGSLEEEVAELVSSGWVAGSVDAWSLTDRGTSSFGRLGEVVGRSRELITTGISAEEYDRTLGLLEQMARNLGWSDPVLPG